MDAEYYFSGGLQLFLGQGFQEPFIWNFLADPSRMPAPSHAYWMPLASILAAAGMKALGSPSFWAGKIPFLLLGACIPPLTALLSGRLNSERPQALWFAGLLAVFPGFYLAYLPTTQIAPARIGQKRLRKASQTAQINPGTSKAPAPIRGSPAWAA